MSSFKFYLPCRNSVRPFGIQCVSEFSAQIFLTVVGIQCLSEFSAQSEFSAGTQLFMVKFRVLVRLEF